MKIVTGRENTTDGSGYKVKLFILESYTVTSPHLETRDEEREWIDKEMKIHRVKAGESVQVDDGE